MFDAAKADFACRMASQASASDARIRPGKVPDNHHG
jgi:hypothetical protein